MAVRCPDRGFVLCGWEPRQMELKSLLGRSGDFLEGNSKELLCQQYSTGHWLFLDVGF